MIENISVLYVDDEPINLLILERNLKKKYNVITAESGLEGLEKLSSNPEIKIVISDMKMPGMNGVDFIKIAKKTYAHIIFFILTGFDINAEIEAALAKGLINKYFRKPFIAKEIDIAIIEATAKQRQ